MRSLMVNKDSKSFKDATLVRGVGKCFSKVEKGAHFTGDSYAVYGELLPFDIDKL